MTMHDCLHVPVGIDAQNCDSRIQVIHDRKSVKPVVVTLNPAMPLPASADVVLTATDVELFDRCPGLSLVLVTGAGREMVLRTRRGTRLRLGLVEPPRSREELVRIAEAIYGWWFGADRSRLDPFVRSIGGSTP